MCIHNINSEQSNAIFIDLESIKRSKEQLIQYYKKKYVESSLTIVDYYYDSKQSLIMLLFKKYSKAY